jgi:hypothetical protein
LFDELWDTKPNGEKEGYTRDLGGTGRTPLDQTRGVGALLAISEGYKGIGFLDADNWYDRDHVERCCAAVKIRLKDCQRIL